MLNFVVVEREAINQRGIPSAEGVTVKVVTALACNTPLALRTRVNHSLVNDVTFAGKLALDIVVYELKSGEFKTAGMRT